MSLTSSIRRALLAQALHNHGVTLVGSSALLVGVALILPVGLSALLIVLGATTVASELRSLHWFFNPFGRLLRRLKDAIRRALDAALPPQSA